MSEKKEFKSLDVGASARIPWKIAKGLRENVGFKDDGSVEIAKNLEIDGNVLSLNGGEWGITPVIIVKDDGSFQPPMLLLRVGKITQSQRTLHIPTSILFSPDEDICLTFSGFDFESDNDNTKVENNVLYLANNEYNTMVENNDFLALVDNVTLDDYLSSKQDKLTLHNLTLTANSKTYNITLQSTNNIKVDSIADLRTILNIKATTDSLITPVCASDLTSTACLQITTALCKIGADNVTAVSDKVTTL